MQVHASRRDRKSMQVDASERPNETQVERKSKTCVDLRLAFTRRAKSQPGESKPLLKTGQK